MASTWRRRATKPPISRVAASGSGLTAGAASWRLGPVVETVGEMAQRLATIADWQPEFAPRQARAFAEAFAEPDPLPAPERAARVIAGFLAHGRVEAAWAPETDTGPALDPNRGTL
jgi:hypothetical protein